MMMSYTKLIDYNSKQGKLNYSDVTVPKALPPDRHTIMFPVVVLV